MSFAGLNTSNNLSFYAVPAAFMTAFLPHLYAGSLVSKGGKSLDLSNPKKTRANIGELGLSPNDQDKFLRAEQANDNGFASLPLFAAAVVAGNLARLPNQTLNRISAIYLASRIAFNYLYIYGTNNAMGMARSLAWVTSTIAWISLFVRAGKKFVDLP